MSNLHFLTFVSTDDKDHTFYCLGFSVMIFITILPTHIFLHLYLLNTHVESVSLCLLVYIFRYLSPSLTLFFISVFIYPAVSLPNSFAFSLSLTLSIYLSLTFSIYLSPFLYFSLFLPIYLSLSLSLLCLLLLYCRRLPRITISICENETRKGWESFLGTKNLGGCVEFRRISTFKCGWKKSKRFRCDRKNCERFRNQSYR